ncbi:unnamed protein product [Euphydryas editha]|uniref:HTH psq-type domain-containing protein n=1 Tax=Euphydryas editha TaxID=104508 RepID=A0AAU9UTQ3_EUPED|nr:unnamed protein product [Euphydryas editha]
MVRNYKKKGTRSGEVDEKAMLKAIDEVLENKLSLRKSSAKYGVNAQTLQSRMKKLRKTQDLGSENRIFESKFASQQVYHSNLVTNSNESTESEELGIAGVELGTVSVELDDVPARTPLTLSRDVSPSLLSQHLASTLIDFDKPAPSTSNVLKTPEIIRPFPKVQRRTQTKKVDH